jgi:hypothetical protein
MKNIILSPIKALEIKKNKGNFTIKIHYKLYLLLQ